MEKVFGPYPDPRGGYRIIVANGPGREAMRRTLRFPTQGEAEAAATKHRQAAGRKLTKELLEEWFGWLKTYEDTKPSSIKTYRYRLDGILAGLLESPPAAITPAKAQRAYDVYAATHAPDTHQGALAATKALFDWMRKRGHLKVSPWVDVDPVGTKRRRKSQHRFDEAAKLYQYLVAKAPSDERELAVLVTLLLGFRAHEVVGITTQDLDAGGTVLWAARSHEGKTENAARPVKLPAVLRDPLVKRAELRSGKLFPYRPSWVRDCAKRACRAAGVTVVGAQALRGLHATLALEAGITGDAVARQLGHGSEVITRGSYALPGSGRSNEVSQITARLSSLGTTPGEGGDVQASEAVNKAG